MTVHGSWVSSSRRAMHGIVAQRAGIYETASSDCRSGCGQLPLPSFGAGSMPSLTSDTGGEPTSLAFIEVGSTLGIHQTFTSDSTLKGNAKRMIRPLKEVRRWLQQWICPLELMNALGNWIAYGMNVI
jgi:hypothetical protein